MKRAVVLGSLAVVVTAFLACHPKEPKQASPPDPGGDEPAMAASDGTNGPGSSSGGHTGPNNLAPPPSGPMGKAAKGEATPVSSLTGMMDGLRWGMSHADVLKMYNENGGVLWKDYDAKLRHARVGPEMTAVEAERESAKQAFARSYVEFKDTPTGYDATGLKGEYTYRNHEAIMSITREGKPKRHFFFINDRLWKIYDEVSLSEGGPLGKSFLDAVNKMNAQLGAQGRIQGADPTKGINATTVDWKDGASHLRVVDRSGERLVAVAVEDNATLGNLASLRTNKAEDPTAIDPTITAVTKGGLSDPNAERTPPAGSASKKPTPPPRKKK